MSDVIQKERSTAPSEITAFAEEVKSRDPDEPIAIQGSKIWVAGAQVLVYNFAKGQCEVDLKYAGVTMHWSGEIWGPAVGAAGGWMVGTMWRAPEDLNDYLYILLTFAGAGPAGMKLEWTSKSRLYWAGRLEGGGVGGGAGLVTGKGKWTKVK